MNSESGIKEIEASDERGGEERKELKYIGVRRRSWGKWVSEIREPKKKRRIWLGSYDNPHMAARAYDAAAICLKGDSAMLNFPHAVHTLPHPISSNSQDIQSAASQAARSFDEHKILLLSDPQSSDPPKEESDREICFESGNGDQAQEGDRMQSMGEVGGWEDLMVESPNMVLNMAEALLVTPPRMHEYDDEIESVEPVYSLWND